MASIGSASEEVVVGAPVAQPDIHEHPDSAPTSAGHEDDDQLEGHSSTESIEKVQSTSVVKPVCQDTSPSGDSSDGSGSSSGSSSETEDGDELQSELQNMERNQVNVDASGGVEAADEREGTSDHTNDAESFTGGYSFSGAGEFEFKVNPAITVPRHYSRFTTEITEVRSVFTTGRSLTHHGFVDRKNRETRYLASGRYGPFRACGYLAYVFKIYYV